VSSVDTNDHAYMVRALQLAERGLFTTHPNPRVGCVIVNGEEVIGEGWHQKVGGPHAEIHALQQAGENARGATAYVTLEPCPMCAGAIVHARVGKVVFAASDPRSGAAGSVFDLLPSDERFNHRTEVRGGVLAEQSAQLLRQFFRARRR